MIKYINKTLKSMQLRKMIEDQSGHQPDTNQQRINRDLDKNLLILQKILGQSPDIVMRRISFGQSPQYHGALLFIDGMVDKTVINQSIIKPLMYDIHLLSQESQLVIHGIKDIENVLISVEDVQVIGVIEDIVKSCLYGSTILLLDGYDEALDISTKGWPARQVQEPPTETAIRGPREGFVETLRINTALLRRRLLDPDLTIEPMVLGTRTRTHIAVAYLKSIANPQLVQEVKERLQGIDNDAILESGYIEQFIEDAPLSPFSTINNTEKPNKVAAKLLEGRVAIMVDGSPFVLTVPMLFIEGFQASEDYYSRPFLSSFIRMLRFGAFLFSLLTPAIYVALTTFHQELIPTKLLITMAAASEGTPFPAVMEAILMVLIFEGLREGSVRLPQKVGPALSIVGALIIGDSVVRAGIISSPVVIVVAATAISTFMILVHQESSTLLRFLLTILAGVLGAFGIIIGLLGILIHLCSLRSFGTPYLSPITPVTLRDLKDTFIRAPLWMMGERPRLLATLNPRRQGWDLKPSPPDKQS